MPHSMSIPFDSYTMRQNRRAQIKPENQVNRPQTERIYSIVAPEENSIAYFNNQDNICISRDHFNSAPISPYSISSQMYSSTERHRQHFSQKPHILPARLPPMQPRPVEYISHKIHDVYQENKLNISKLAPVSDVEFIAKRQLSKPISNQTYVSAEKIITKIGGSGKRQFITGATILTLSLGMFLFYDSMMSSILDSSMQLKEGGSLTENWKNVPLPVDACFYLFELKNGKQFLKGAKPRVVEHGPFCYLEFKKRTVLKWEEHTVTFTERFEFEFNEKASASLDIRIQVLNLPLLLTVYMIKHTLESVYLSFTSPVVFNMIAMTLRATGEELLEMRTAREILEGRKIKMVEYSEMMLYPLKALGIPVPAFGVGTYKMHNASFGFVSQRMWTDFGPYEVYTKTEDGHTFGEIHTFEDQDTMPGYNFPCNQLKGGDGMFFGPNSYKQTLTVFNQHACRSLSFVRNATITKSGMTVVRYTIDPHLFDMSLRRNRCFCLSNRAWQECDGWTDMSPCMGGIPMGLSFPHFYNTPRRLSEVDGLSPDAAKHFGYLDLEPQIGTPIGASIALQGTIAIKAISSVSALSSLPTVVLPLFWVNEGATVKGVMAIGMSIGSNSIRFGSYAWLLGGIAYAAVAFYRGNKKRKQTQRLETIK